MWLLNGRNGLKESTFKQDGRFDDYALLLSNFDGVIKTAVGIKSHINRYNDDNRLREVCVMLGAFLDGSWICPVKLEIKHFHEENTNKLHIAVTKSEINKADVYAGLQRRQHHAVPTARGRNSYAQKASRQNDSNTNPCLLVKLALPMKLLTSFVVKLFALLIVKLNFSLAIGNFTTQ